MKNKENIGKEARPELRGAIQAFAPEGCLGGCPKCGDYMEEEKEKAVCCYCGFEDDIKNWKDTADDPAQELKNDQIMETAREVKAEIETDNPDIVAPEKLKEKNEE